MAGRPTPAGNRVGGSVSTPVPGTTAVAVRRYLFDTLTATLAPDPLSKTSDLLVCYDEPGPYQPDDIVSVGKVERTINTNSMVGGGGAGWLEESYTVDVDIEVFRGGDDPQGVFTRTSDLIDQIAAVAREDPSLGERVLVCKPTASTCEVEWDEEHKGRLGNGSITFSCYQRI